MNKKNIQSSHFDRGKKIYKLSIVATVFNEENTVIPFLDSLLRQTLLPDEIIIVDGGSSDRTVANIKYQISNIKYQKNTSKVKILIKPKTTIAQGRNFGIKNASGDIIVMSDAGCVAHKDWLEKITKPFKEQSADIVGGFYTMTGKKALQKALAIYLGIPPTRFNPRTFLPSARSIAFKKSLWEKIGGFNEKLEQAGEDTLFNYEALRVGAKFVRVKDALVDWEVPESLWEGIKKFYVYAKGDAQAGIWWHPTQQMSTHNLKIAAIIFRYTFGFVLLLLSIRIHWLLSIVFVGFILYLFWSVWKMRDVVTDFRPQLWLPILQVTSDIAVMYGALVGLVKRFPR